jgi:hypothetical protein
MNDPLSDAYVVLDDDETFAPLIGCLLVNVNQWPEGYDAAEEDIQDASDLRRSAEHYTTWKLVDVVRWAFANGYLEAYPTTEEE